MLQEIWSDTAQFEYENTIGYLLNRWTAKEALNFISKTEQVIESLKRNPQLGSSTSKRKDVRRILITRHTTLFYQVQGEVLKVVSIWNNYQNPDKQLT